MTDTALQSLYPVNQIGADGFNWWVGQIEQGSTKDPKGSGRCKVRIVGLHPQQCDVVDDKDLPWATTMMPVTNPHSPGGLFSVTPKLKSGHWVVGFFMDNDKQQPVIIGSVGRVANSTSTSTAEKSDPSEGCNSLTTYIDDQKLASDQPTTQNGEVPAPVTAVDAGHAQDGTKRVTENNLVITSSLTRLQKAKYSKNSATNPAGVSWCIEKADRCGKDTNLTGTFTHLFSEMLYEVQRNDGKLGTYLVGELSGDLYDVIDVGREYVNKAILVVKTFIANIKGFVIKQIKAAVKALTNALLRPTDKGNALSAVTAFLNNALAKVGCKMADLGDRLAAWLEDIIFGYLFNLYKSTACQVDEFVGGLINKIQSLMNELLSGILGPLQDLLGAIAEPLNMIGDAINYVLNLLGIQCTGPGQKCSKTTKVCTDCNSEEREDFLDKLLKDLSGSDAQDWNQYTCKDNSDGIKLNPTKTSFVGGVQNSDRNIIYSISDITVAEGEKAIFTVTRTGYTDIVSSVTYKTRDGSASKATDYEETTGVLGFVKGEKSKVIQVQTFNDTEVEAYEDFYLRIFVDSPGEEIAKSSISKNIARCTIKGSNITSGTASPTDPSTGLPIPSNPSSPSSNPDIDLFTTVSIPTATTATTNLPSYTVTPDKITVKEGEFVKYTITTTNVPSGTTLNYQLFGPSITPSDIIGNNLSGTFIIEDSDAEVVVGINKDTATEDEETLIFSIPGTGATASVIILSDLSDLTEEEISELEDKSTNDLFDNKPLLPTTGVIITDNGGGIIDIPVDTPGTPYKEPPKIFITGEGYGAQAEALLDPKGFVTEIRVIDPGFGYKINIPDSAGKECIIDSFTMIRPGRDYTSAPTVYVDGRIDIAEAVINTKGQITSVRIKDRTTTFSSYPVVKILGGGGYGAKFLPSFACLDPVGRVKVGSAKVGTGSYIDCP